MRENPGVGNPLSRRSFLRQLGHAGTGGALASVMPGMGRTTSLDRGLPAFEQILPSASGISWVHVAGLSAMKYNPETMGAGCAFLDYDNDGWIDIYFVNSGQCDFYRPKRPLRNALYHNNRNGTFTDVTEKAGVPGGAYGMGVAVGDYDADGFPDIYVLQYPTNILYHNNGDGTFTDVTDKAGVRVSGWGTSAVWFDYDNDGRLDLFACQFVKLDESIVCGNKLTGQRWYCRPSVYQPRPSWLFHNNGDGTLTDVSNEIGIAGHPGKAWSAVAADINNDGWIDLFVSNDTMPNFLYLNHKGKRLEDIGVLAGVGYSEMGLARSGMGVDAADYDQDGWIDLFVSNVDHEMFSLYHNNRNETFDDVAMSDGIGSMTMLLTGMGVKFFDYDNDGNLDLLSANGHPEPSVRNMVPGVTYQEPLLLLRGNGRGGFQNVSNQSGPIFSQRIAGRGLAIGDFDNDGSVDALVAINNAAPILLRNHAGQRNHWLGVQLIGRKSNIDAIGAKVTYQSGNFRRHRTKVGGGSYLSAHDPRIVLGLGPRTRIDWLEVQWPQPGGTTERFTDLPIDRYVTIVEGEGKWK
jgi:enediyne biosynthesis protein E4